MNISVREVPWSGIHREWDCTLRWPFSFEAWAILAIIYNCNLKFNSFSLNRKYEYFPLLWQMLVCVCIISLYIVSLVIWIPGKLTSTGMVPSLIYISGRIHVGPMCLLRITYISWLIYCGCGIHAVDYEAVFWIWVKSIQTKAWYTTKQSTLKPWTYLKAFTACHSEMLCREYCNLAFCLLGIDRQEFNLTKANITEVCYYLLLTLSLICLWKCFRKKIIEMLGYTGQVVSHRDSVSLLFTSCTLSRETTHML